MHERDAVTAHLALQMGGCTRSSKLHQQQAPVGTTLREMGRTLWDEPLLLLGRLVDFVKDTAPRLLTGPRASS